MYRFKRILVNLNMNEHDTGLIQKAYKIAEMANSEKLYFQYVEEKLDVPAELVKEYPQLIESVADFARDKIKDTIQIVNSSLLNPEPLVLVNEGSALDEILKQVRINGIDLVISGVSSHLPESRELATKLARKAPCSVLVVPQGVELDFSNPGVALDFSEHSKDAYDQGLAFAKAGKAVKMEMIHVYEIPTGFHKTGRSYVEFAEIMKNNAKKNFQQLASDFETGNLEIIENYLIESKTAEAIRKHVNENKISFLAVGAKGRSAGAALMLGSVSEKLIESLNIPVLAVKKKGSGLNILNVIFN
ncbi:MAG: universal stress protein [Calditrichae bacterium]|nr:universal stress protein [Calditrichia bacterium]